MRRQFIILFLLTIALTGKANDRVFSAAGNQLIPETETDISVTKEILTISLQDDDYASVDVYYEFYNKEREKTVTVGFEAAPPSYNDNSAYSPKGIHPYISDFSVIMNKKRIKYKNYVVKGENFEESLDWEGDLDCTYVYSFNAKFKHGLNIVHHTYRYKTSCRSDETFDLPYLLTPALRWANHQIDDFTLRIKTPHTAKHFIVADSTFVGADFAITEGVGKMRKNIHYGPSAIEVSLRNGCLEWHKQNFCPNGELFIESADVIYFENLKLGFYYDRGPYYSPIRYNGLYDKPESPFELRIIRNLPYASRGYVFHKKELQDYFSQFWWYMPDPTYKLSMADFTPNEHKLLKGKVE